MQFKCICNGILFFDIGVVIAKAVPWLRNCKVARFDPKGSRRCDRSRSFNACAFHGETCDGAKRQDVVWMLSAMLGMNLTVHADAIR